MSSSRWVDEAHLFIGSTIVPNQERHLNEEELQALAYEVPRETAPREFVEMPGSPVDSDVDGPWPPSEVDDEGYESASGHSPRPLTTRPRSPSPRLSRTDSGRVEKNVSRKPSRPQRTRTRSEYVFFNEVSLDYRRKDHVIVKHSRNVFTTWTTRDFADHLYNLPRAVNPIYAGASLTTLHTGRASNGHKTTQQ